MAGIEVALIIGAGILITLKVREQKAAKKGRLAQGHGLAQMTTSDKTLPYEDEVLSRYSLSEKQHSSNEKHMNLPLSTYEETLVSGLNGSGPAIEPDRQSHRWNTWRRSR